MARTRNQGSKWIAKSTRFAIYHRDSFRCCYCGCDASQTPRLTLDHVVACELGGGNDVENLVTACLSCNSAKRDLTMRQFLRYLRELDINTKGMAQRVRNATKRQIDRAEGRRLAAIRAAIISMVTFCQEKAA